MWFVLFYALLSFSVDTRRRDAADGIQCFLEISFRELITACLYVVRFLIIIIYLFHESNKLIFIAHFI